MVNIIHGNILLGTIAEMKTCMEWFQANYPTNLKLQAIGFDLTVSFNFTVIDLDVGITAVQAILAEYPQAVWTADLE